MFMPLESEFCEFADERELVVRAVLVRLLERDEDDAAASLRPTKRPVVSTPTNFVPLLELLVGVEEIASNVIDPISVIADRPEPDELDVFPLLDVFPVPLDVFPVPLELFDDCENAVPPINRIIIIVYRCIFGIGNKEF